jgi:hypothetical protein
MKRVALCALVLAFAAGLTGCASYWSDRGRDAADILSFQVGTGAGTKVRVGPFQAGLLSENGIAGLRGGALVGPSQYRAGSDEGPSKWDDVLVLVGWERFEGGPTSIERGKAFKGRQIVLSVPFNLASDQDYEGKTPVPYNPWPYLAQVEAVGGAFLTFRVGANPGELLDFILGWTTLDIFGDDLRF